MARERLHARCAVVAARLIETSEEKEAGEGLIECASVMVRDGLPDEVAELKSSGKCSSVCRANACPKHP